VYAKHAPNDFLQIAYVRIECAGGLSRSENGPPRGQGSWYGSPDPLMFDFDNLKLILSSVATNE